MVFCRAPCATNWKEVQMLRIIFTLISLAVLTACATAADPQAANRICGADSLQHLLGEPGSQVALLGLPAPLRMIDPGTMVTRDFRPDRINFEMDETGVIRLISCG
jgi:peptidase inhibitor I78 family protein